MSDKTSTHQTLTTEPGDLTKGGRDFRWDYAVFEVEGKIFRVPKHELVRSSPIFQATYLGGGAGDDNPVRLEGYPAKDFEALLTVLYPSMEAVQSGKYELTKEQWIGVLKLSRPWKMTKIHELAIQNLSTGPATLTPMEKVTLAPEHRKSSWLVKGLTSLVLDNPKPSRAELVERLGLQTAFRILGIQFDEFQRSVSEQPRYGETWLTLPPPAVLCANCREPFYSGLTCRCQKALDGEHGDLRTWKTLYVHVEDAGSVVYLQPKTLHCVYYNSEVGSEATNCGNCGHTPDRYNKSMAAYARLGFPSPSKVESMIRQEFKDEIDEYDKLHQ